MTLGLGTNQIESFALGVGANVETPANWQADTVRQQGFEGGIASSQKANTVLRQATFIAAMIAQFSADFSGAPCNDDGNILNAEQNFINALSAALAVQGVYYLTDTGTANAMVATGPSTGPAAYSSPCLVIIKKMNAPNTGAMTANFWNLGVVALTDNTGAAMSSGALLASSYYLLTYSGGGFHVLGGAATYTSVSNLTANSGDMIQVTAITGVVNLRIGTGVHSATVGAGDMWPRGNAADDTCRYMLTSELLAWLSAALATPSLTGFTRLQGWSVGGVKTANWTADQVIASVSMSGVGYRGANLSLAFNGATTGVNGMDTGSMPANTDLSIYAIYNPTTSTWATLGCAGSTSLGTVYVGSHMPSGYTASVLIWTGVTVNSKIPEFNQSGRYVCISPTFFVLESNDAGHAASVASYVPYNALSCAGIMQTDVGTGTVSLSANPDGVGLQNIYSGSTSVNGVWGPIVMSNPQQIYWAYSGSFSGSAAVSSYSF